MVPVLFAYGGWQTASLPRRRGARAAAQPAARADRRRGRGGGALPAGQRGLPARPRHRRAGGHRDAGLRGDAGGAWAAPARGSSPPASPSRPSASSARACSPRRGSTTRWPPTACSSAASPGSTRAPGCRWRRSPCRGLGDRHRAVGPLRADPQLRGVGGLDLLRPGGGVPVRPAPPRRGRAAAVVHHPRPPLDHRRLRRVSALVVVNTVYKYPRTAPSGWGSSPRACRCTCSGDGRDGHLAPASANDEGCRSDARLR